MKKVTGFLKSHTLSLIFLLLTVSVICVISIFSSQAGVESSGSSYGFTYWVVSVFTPKFSALSEAQRQAEVLRIAPFMRKLAHFSLFAALGFFSHLTAVSFLRERESYEKKLPAFLSAAAFCLAYSVRDEIRQLFIVGRSGNILDVFIDFSGSVFGIIFALLCVIVFLGICRKKEKNGEKYRK